MFCRKDFQVCNCCFHPLLCCYKSVPATKEPKKLIEGAKLRKVPSKKKCPPRNAIYFNQVVCNKLASYILQFWSLVLHKFAQAHISLLAEKPHKVKWKFKFSVEGVPTKKKGKIKEETICRLQSSKLRWK